jgi:hypothetical protein
MDLAPLITNYWTPLTKQVEDSEAVTKQKTIKWNIKLESIQQMTGTDEATSAVYDYGATSNCGRETDNFIPTNEKSEKVFIYQPATQPRPAKNQNCTILSANRHAQSTLCLI